MATALLTSVITEFMAEEHLIEVVVSVPREEAALIEAIQSMDDISTAKVDGAGFEGGGEFWQVVCTLGGAGIGALTAILRARIAQSKNVTIEVNGMKVSGADPDRIEALLAMMLEADRQNS